jgi:2-polyprenyl-6-methoxyphenol hydroxylase-like FAD-dependent oxidoreductase
MVEGSCCIVGGGPAGMMLGFLLARAGVRVTVLEKHADFLRDFRGDTIHPSTLDVIAELGLLKAFLARPHDEVRELVGDVFGHELTLADFTHLPTRCKFLAFMPQWDFLDFIAGEARKLPGFKLCMQHEVTALRTSGTRITGVVARTPDGPATIDADLISARMVGTASRGSWPACRCWTMARPSTCCGSACPRTTATARRRGAMYGLASSSSPSIAATTGSART